jgi:hypothetical protein
MAWNPSPKVANARDIGKKYNKDIVIFVMFDEDTLELISYGKTKKLCSQADLLAQKINDFIIKESEK